MNDTQPKPADEPICSDCGERHAAGEPCFAKPPKRITRADIQTTGEKIPYFGHMRKLK